jgi:hypothetical protein
LAALYREPLWIREVAHFAVVAGGLSWTSPSHRDNAGEDRTTERRIAPTPRLRDDLSGQIQSLVFLPFFHGRAGAQQNTE